MLYEAIEVDRCRYDLLLKVKYKMTDINIAPAVIKRDKDVKFFLRETSTSLQHRTPLCITLVPKPIPANPTQESNIPSIVPETADPIFERNETQLYQSHDQPWMDYGYRGMHPCEGGSCSVASTRTTPAPSSSQGGKTSTSSHVFGSYDRLIVNTPSLEDVMTSENEFKVSTLFENKKELQLKLHKYAMSQNFEFKVEKSTKDLWYVRCMGENCTWRLRAVRGKFSEMFEVRKFVHEHTCSIVMRHQDNRQATSWVIGECIKSKFQDHHHDHLPKKIIEDMQTNYGINMSYHKAWRSREKALMSVRGTPEESYTKLPSYLYMLEVKNPGTVTHIETDELGQFR